MNEKELYNLILTLPKNDRVEVFDRWHIKSCPYGQPDGPDDYCTDCECSELITINHKEIK